MRLKILVLACMAACTAAPALAAAGNVQAGQEIVMRTCSLCHAPGNAKTASDVAPPLSYIARHQKENPGWIHAWLTSPHPPMPGIMLSRNEIDNIMAYLATLPTAPQQAGTG